GEPPGAAELGGDRGVDRGQHAGGGGRVVRAAGRVGELLERPRVEALADDADRVDGDAVRVRLLDRLGEARLAGDVAAVRQEDHDPAEVLLRLERLRREHERVVERGAGAGVDRDLPQRLRGVDG